MAQPYVGEIRMFGGSFAPAGWAFCNGALMPIAENEVLFQLIGTTYGGDGQETFALPSLSSRIPIHMGTGGDGQTYQIGELLGTESVTLTTQQIPVHSHAAQANNSSAINASPTNSYLARSSTVDMFINANPSDAMSSNAIIGTGGSQPHDNMQPFLCVSFIISLFGIFPSPT
ncbi:MAG: tail fiber protein [Bacteroidota bacterium]